MAAMLEAKEILERRVGDGPADLPNMKIAWREKKMSSTKSTCDPDSSLSSPLKAR